MTNHNLEQDLESDFHKELNKIIIEIVDEARTPNQIMTPLAFRVAQIKSTVLELVLGALPKPIKAKFNDDKGGKKFASGHNFALAQAEAAIKEVLDV